MSFISCQHTKCAIQCRYIYIYKLNFTINHEKALAWPKPHIIFQSWHHCHSFSTTKAAVLSSWRLKLINYTCGCVWVHESRWYLHQQSSVGSSVGRVKDGKQRKATTPWTALVGAAEVHREMQQGAALPTEGSRWLLVHFRGDEELQHRSYCIC